MQLKYSVLQYVIADVYKCIYLLVCQQDYRKRRTWLKFSGKVSFGPGYNRLDFGGNGPTTWRTQRKN